MGGVTVTVRHHLQIKFCELDCELNMIFSQYRMSLSPLKSDKNPVGNLLKCECPLEDLDKKRFYHEENEVGKPAEDKSTHYNSQLGGGL